MAFDVAARVVARDPAEVVTSPVRAGKFPAASVPDTSVPKATAPNVGSPAAAP